MLQAAAAAVCCEEREVREVTAMCVREFPRPPRPQAVCARDQAAALVRVGRARAGHCRQPRRWFKPRQTTYAGPWRVLATSAQGEGWLWGTRGPRPWGNMI